MTRYLLPFCAVGLLSLVRPAVTTTPDPITAQERFALELQACAEARAGDKPGKCELFGEIQVVDSFPDVTIEKVDAFPDIKVEWVDAFADAPGKWEKVDAHADYKVQFVDAHADYEVQFVDAFPGCD